MNIKTLVFIGLCCGFSYAGQAQDSSEDKQFVENFMQAQPNLKYVPQAEFSALSEKKQQQYKAAGYLICAGETLTRKDLEAYQARRAAVDAQAANPEKAQAYLDKKNSLTPPPPAAVPLTFRVSRAELATIPAEKQAYMLAHPEVYIIID